MQVETRKLTYHGGRVDRAFYWSRDGQNRVWVRTPMESDTIFVKKVKTWSEIITKMNLRQFLHQDGRVVKALDLSSNGGIPAWVRTSLLVNFFYFFISPAAHQWFQPIRDQNRHREGKNAQYELNSNFKERLAKIMKTWHRFKKMGRLKIGLGWVIKCFLEISTR